MSCERRGEAVRQNGERRQAPFRLRIRDPGGYPAVAIPRGPARGLQPRQGRSCRQSTVASRKIRADPQKIGRKALQIGTRDNDGSLTQDRYSNVVGADVELVEGLNIPTSVWIGGLPGEEPIARENLRRLERTRLKFAIRCHDPDE